MEKLQVAIILFLGLAYVSTQVPPTWTNLCNYNICAFNKLPVKGDCTSYQTCNDAIMTFLQQFFPAGTKWWQFFTSSCTINMSSFTTLISGRMRSKRSLADLMQMMKSINLNNIKKTWNFTTLPRVKCAVNTLFDSDDRCCKTWSLLGLQRKLECSSTTAGPPVTTTASTSTPPTCAGPGPTGQWVAGQTCTGCGSPLAVGCTQDLTAMLYCDGTYIYLKVCDPGAGGECNPSDPERSC